MSEAGTRPASAAGFKGVLLVLGVSLGVIFITSFVYRLGNPSMVRELRRSAAPAPGEGGMEGMGGNRIRDLMAAMGENPDDPAIPLELGESFMIMQAWPRALVFLDRTLELDPKNVRAMRGKGMALFETKKPGEASEVFEAILKIEPNDPQVHYNLGIIKRYYLEKPEEGRTHFERVLEIGSNDPELLEHARSELEKSTE